MAGGSANGEPSDCIASMNPFNAGPAAATRSARWNASAISSPANRVVPAGEGVPRTDTPARVGLDAGVSFRLLAFATAAPSARRTESAGPVNGERERPPAMGLILRHPS
jgi:hypothetical protein